MNRNHHKWGTKAMVLFVSFLFVFSTFLVYGSQIHQKDMKAESDPAPFIDIASGNVNAFTYILTNNHVVFSFNPNQIKNESGALGNGNFNYVGGAGRTANPVLRKKANGELVPLNGIEKMAVSAQNGDNGIGGDNERIVSVFLSNDGTLYGLGNGGYGAFANYVERGEYGLKFPYAIEIGNINEMIGITTSDVKDLMITNENIFILTNDGFIYGCGKNSVGQLTLDGTTDNELHEFLKLNLVDENGTIIKADSLEVTMDVFGVLSNGNVYVWGKNVQNALGIESNDPIITRPMQVKIENTDGTFSALSNIDRFNIIESSHKPEGNDDYWGLSFFAHDSVDNYIYYWGYGALQNVDTNNSLVKYPLKLKETNTVDDYIVVEKNDYEPGINSLYYKSKGKLYMLVNALYGNFPFETSEYPRGQEAFNGATGKHFDFDSVKALYPTLDSNNYQTLVLFKDNTLCLASWWNIDNQLGNQITLVALPKFSISAVKKDSSVYDSAEKYNDDIEINISKTIESQEVTYTCTDHINGTSNQDIVTSNVTETIKENERIYKTYTFRATGNSSLIFTYIVDLYKGDPVINSLSKNSLNGLRLGRSIPISVPDDQKDWNSYSATLTDSNGTKTDYHGEAINQSGLYTLEVSDAYGNTAKYQIRVYSSLTDILYHSSVDLTEGLNALKGITSGNIEVLGLGPYEIELIKDGKTSASDIDSNGNPLTDDDVDQPLSKDFIFDNSSINLTNGTADLKIINNLSAGTYYVKIRAKDCYDGADMDSIYPGDAGRVIERVIKITVKEAPKADDNVDLSSFEFKAVSNLRVGIEAVKNTKAGDFITIPDGYSLVSSVVATPKTTTTNTDAAHFKINGSGSGATLQIDSDIETDKTYFLRIYLSDGTTLYSKDIEVTIDPGYPQITSLGYSSPYTLTYGDASIIPSPTASIGTANVTLSEPDDGNSPYTFDLIDDATYPDNQYFEVDSQGAVKYTGTSKLGANTSGYTIKVEVTDSHGQKKSEEVKMIVNKATQKNYAITNTGEIFVSNKTIPITTSGKESDSTGAESFDITEGKGSVASISSTNQYQMLSIGTFKLEATIAEDANYLETVVTKEIELSDLPVQSPAISITSSDEMTYGTTYTPAYTGGQGNGSITWSIDSDNGTGAVLNNGKITVSNVGTFTLKVVKAGSGVYQDSEDSITVTVNPLSVTVKPNNVSIKTGQAFTDQGVMYTPNIISGDASKIGTPVITTAYKVGDGAGAYDITITGGLANPNYTFTYTKGTLTVSDVTLPDNGDQDKSPYYTVIGTKGNNGWYTSDIKIKTTGKDGYTKVSQTNGSFIGDTITVSTEGEYDISLYFQHTDGTITKPITYKVKIDKTAPSVPTMTVDELNTSRMARLINLLSFGSWMNEEAQVTMLSSDPISGIDYYEYVETIKSIDSQPKSSNGTLTYGDETELLLKARACDKAGNCSTYTNSEELKIDKKGPTILGVKDQSVYKQYYIPRFITIEDLVSGPDQATYTKDGGTPIDMDLTKPTKIAGEGTYTIKAIDVAQNISELTFKIIPFPDIKTEIDGSNESKEIIDQIQEELDEVKNQLELDEVKDYEKWIEDATDWWESLRKKVVETDDKSAKVEGIGDTSFDPKVELIVDPITENDVPTLPRKAISIYDVYLKKGEQEILPNGEIKVYLPYTEDETPIIYEIDDDGTIKEITGTMEDGFATFHTTVLKKYAISNTKQEENKDPDDNENQKPTPNPDDGKDPDNNQPDPNPDDGDNNDPTNDKVCSVGPDGKPNTSDDVCGKPNDEGDKPVINPDGSITVPDGGSVIFPDGSEIELPDGGTINPDGSVELPDGTIYDKDGNKKEPDQKKECKIKDSTLNVDTDGNGIPDINLDLDGDCYPDINIDVDGDNIPDVNIDTTGDGKPNINIDINNDGTPDLNMTTITSWKPNLKANVNGFAYETMTNITSDKNIDTNGDGYPDENVDDDWYTSRGIEKPGNSVKGSYNNSSKNTGGASTGDHTKWAIWWILMIITVSMMGYSFYRKRKKKILIHNDLK